MGISAGSKTLGDKELHHDADKLLHINDKRNPTVTSIPTWVKTTIKGQAVLPFNLVFDLGLFNFSASAYANGAFLYSTTSSTPIAYKNSNGIFKKIKEKTSDVFYGVKAIALPAKSKDLLKHFKQGTEHEYIMDGSIVTLLEAGANISFFSAGAHISVLTSTKLQKKIKMVSDLGKKYIHLSYRSITEEGTSRGVSLNYGITIFETKNLDGLFKATILATNNIKSSSDSLEYQFIFDLDNKEAKVALDKALKGDLREAQRLAKWRDEYEDNNNGILLLNQREEHLTSLAKNITLGFLFNELNLKTPYGSLKPNLNISDVLRFSKKIIRTENILTQHSNGDDYITITENKRQKVKETKILWQLLANSKSESSINTQILHTTLVDEENQNAIHKNVNSKLHYKYEISGKNATAKKLNKFFNNAAMAIGYQSQEMRSFISDIQKTKKCSKKYNILYEGIFNQIAIDNIINKEEEDIWKAVAIMLEETDHSIFIDKEKRKKRLKTYKTFANKYFENPSKTISDYQEEIKERYNNINRLISLDISSQFKKAKLASELKDKLLILQELFIKYDDPFLFSLFSVLAYYENTDPKKDRDIFAKYYIKSSNCDFKWGLIKPSQQYFLQ